MDHLSKQIKAFAIDYSTLLLGYTLKQQYLGDRDIETIRAKAELETFELIHNSNLDDYHDFIDGIDEEG